MKLNKKISFIVISLMILACCFTVSGCKNDKSNTVRNTVSQDFIENRIEFGKKYYWLGYDCYDENQYYTFNDDGTATYTHIMKEGSQTTFHQVINFKWTYGGEGNCIMLHNGTEIKEGEQDDAFGIARVMHVAKDVVYWSASGENTYYICENFVDQIPNYAQMVDE